MLALRCIGVGLSLVLGIGFAPARAAEQSPAVSTIAGDGTLGIRDGNARSASFVLPAAVAYGPDGTLYIADAGAQRIRAMGKDGAIVTVAGGGELDASTGRVAGGYADGSALQARFRFPDGLAVAPSGDIYVADKDNHCIRLISHGIVSTYAGSPSNMSQTNGPRASARFRSPRGLALDRDGNLYIADPFTGLRVIDAGGNVRNVRLHVTQPFGVAVLDAPHYRTVVVADALGIIALLPPRGTQARWGFSDSIFKGDHVTQGNKPLGYPFGITAVDDSSTVAYTDARTNTVRMLNLLDSNEHILGGNAIEDAANSGGGFTDGSVSRFSGPAGIAQRSDGSLAVADMGNRRIRMIAPLDRREVFRPNEGGALVPVNAFTNGDYRIFLLGNSAVWWNNSWNDSINALLEVRLHSAHPRAHVQPVSIPGASLQSDAQYVKLLATNNLTDAVVLIVNSGTLEVSYKLKHDQLIAAFPKWRGPFTASLRELANTLRRAHVPFLVILVPNASEVSFNENVWNEVLKDTQNISYAPLGDELALAAQEAGVTLLNLWPVFRQYTSSAQREPLYPTFDEHLAAQGRALVADSIADTLTKLIP